MVLRGDALFRLGRYRDAVGVYDDALEKDPDNRSAKNSREAARRRMP